jgi:hypothetical protein
MNKPLVPPYTARPPGLFPGRPRVMLGDLGSKARPNGSGAYAGAPVIA